MKQPNLGYADVKLDFACMHPAGCACRVSLCDYYDLCGSSPTSASYFSKLYHSIIPMYLAKISRRILKGAQLF